MTELSFLLEILFKHKTREQTEDAILERIKIIEMKQYVVHSHGIAATLPMQSLATVHGAPQAASTIAALAKHGIIGPEAAPEPAPLSIENVAQTPKAAEALAQRQALINRQISGKGTESPKIGLTK